MVASVVGVVLVVMGGLLFSATESFSIVIIKASFNHELRHCTDDVTRMAGIIASFNHELCHCTDDVTRMAGIIASFNHELCHCTDDVTRMTGIVASFMPGN
jgi:hypothetical protein